MINKWSGVLVNFPNKSAVSQLCWIIHLYILLTKRTSVFWGTSLLE